MLRFVAADLKRHWIGALAVVLIIGLAAALGVMVTLQERAVRLGSARAASAFDLVIGAPGSDTQLVLSSVFLQPAPLPLLPTKVLADLAADPRVAWSAPIGFGDFVDDLPLVGTTDALVEGIGGVSEGHSFATLGDALVGALVARNLGDTFHPLHGRLTEGGHMHGAVTYTVVGRMKPTGTAWDRAVLVPIQTVWLVHVHDPEEEQEHGAAGGAGGTEHEEDEAPLDLSGPVDTGALSDPAAPGAPAILVKPKTFADAYKLRQEYRSDHSLAVFPAEVLTRLYATLGDIRTVLAIIAAGAQVLVGAAILLVVGVQVMQRRRQIGALRAFGAPRVVVFAIVWLEVFLIAGLGILIGFALGFFGAHVATDILTRASGIVMPVVFDTNDLGSLASLLVLTAIAASLPAVLAYRQSPASALRS